MARQRTFFDQADAPGPSAVLRPRNTGGEVDRGRPPNSRRLAAYFLRIRDRLGRSFFGRAIRLFADEPLMAPVRAVEGLEAAGEIGEQRSRLRRRRLGGIRQGAQQRRQAARPTRAVARLVLQQTQHLAGPRAGIFAVEIIENVLLEILHPQVTETAAARAAAAGRDMALSELRPAIEENARHTERRFRRSPRCASRPRHRSTPTLPSFHSPTILAKCGCRWRGASIRSR